MKRLKFEQKVVERKEEDGYDKDAASIIYFKVINKKGDSLGVINREHWGRWTWEPETSIVMSRGCLQEIVEFMKTLGGKD